MIIDPLTIPCPFCGGKGEKRESVEYGMEISCLACVVTVCAEGWLTGGINALVGKLLRFGVSIWRSEGGWTWDDDYDIGGSGPTLEACVLDAWEKIREKG